MNPENQDRTVGPNRCFTADAYSLRFAALCELSARLSEELEKLRPTRLSDLKLPICLKAEVRNFERELIKAALFTTGGRQKEAAGLLGLNRSTLSDKVRRLKIATENWMGK